jgi:hypothetical protein
MKIMGGMARPSWVGYFESPILARLQYWREMSALRAESARIFGVTRERISTLEAQRTLFSTDEHIRRREVPPGDGGIVISLFDGEEGA